MSDEKPLHLTKIRKISSEPEDVRICVVHNFVRGETSEVKRLTENTYSRILQAKSIRQVQVNPSVRLDEICSKIPTEFNPDTQGYHAWCYSSFTNVSRLKDATPSLPSAAAANPSSCRSSGRSSMSSQSEGLLFPSDTCLFCDKKKKTRRNVVDTRIVLHCLYASQSASSQTHIVVRSPDTDVLVILVHYSEQIHQSFLMETGTGDKRRFIDVHGITKEIGIDIAKALPAIHAFTGSDCMSSFVRRGKVKAIKILQSNPKFISVFHSLGSEAGSQFEVLTVLPDLERFVCSLYGKPSYASTDKLRYDMFKSRYEAKSSKNSVSIENGLNLSLLPPCSSSLQSICISFEQTINLSSGEIPILPML